MELAPQLLRLPSQRIWTSYDEEADVLYQNFKKPSHADDTELTDNDILIRYEKAKLSASPSSMRDNARQHFHDDRNPT